MKTDTAESLNSLASSLGFNLDFESPEELKRSNRALADALTTRGVDLAKLLAKYPTDELTGLGNKNDLLRYGWHNLAEADREGQHVTLVFTDVDDLKALNTRYGERKVDEMVAAGGWAIKEVLRPYDKAWRFGGDEFVFVLRGKGSLNIPMLIQRIERKWEQRLAQKNLPEETIRLSFGFVLIKPKESRGNQASQVLFESSLSEAVLKMRRMKAGKKTPAKLQ